MVRLQKRAVQVFVLCGVLVLLMGWMMWGDEGSAVAAKPPVEREGGKGRTEGERGGKTSSQASGVRGRRGDREEENDFWTSFGRVEVFVMTMNSTMNRWRHLRDVVSAGPWKINLVPACTVQSPEVQVALAQMRSRKNLEEKPVALLCSHYMAAKMAHDKQLDYALILEDDAQFIPDFWRRLQVRLRHLPDFGVFYLQYSSNENIIQANVENLIKWENRPILRKYDPTEVFNIGAGAFDTVVGTIWDAAGYMLSRKGIQRIAKYPVGHWLLKTRSAFGIYSSEMMLSYVAEDHGAYFSIPALIYQCTSKISSVQRLEKASNDNVGRWKQKAVMTAILKSWGEDGLPDWLLECGFQ